MTGSSAAPYLTCRRLVRRGRAPAPLFDLGAPAQLMSAFSYYALNDYNKSIESARRFLAIHPGNRAAPYAHYLIALSYYEQISDVTRDQGVTQQALGLVRRAGAALPHFALFGRRPAQDGPGARPSGRQGHGGRALLPAAAPVAGLGHRGSAR
jgi:tetratricopeptide (TPR) repeat protein